MLKAEIGKLPFEAARCTCSREDSGATCHATLSDGTAYVVLAKAVVARIVGVAAAHGQECVANPNCLLLFERCDNFPLTGITCNIEGEKGGKDHTKAQTKHKPERYKRDRA